MVARARSIPASVVRPPVEEPGRRARDEGEIEMATKTLQQGKFVWFELVTGDAAKA